MDDLSCVVVFGEVWVHHNEYIISNEKIHMYCYVVEFE